MNRIYKITYYEMSKYSITMFALFMICVILTNNSSINAQMIEYYTNDDPQDINTYESIYPRYIHRYRPPYKRGGMYGGLLGKRLFNQ
ncbi:hypothetical protein MN116_005237 [Schistosoma mekongi]|uniref:Uncharacterized protein n=1 Tax=Schistosoma mekongi TaxID=38744 RepID=A0AAE1ZEI4_SCHME|nr:hypothetical protein MN116_005237 [Schistosoma mekongi]